LADLSRAFFRRRRIHGVAALAALGVISACTAAQAIEKRAFVVGWAAPATNSQEGDCDPAGVNPPWEKQRLKNLADLGYSGSEIEALASKAAESEKGSDDLDEIMAMRGRLNGQPVKAVEYPETVPDPKLHIVTGRYAYGFNLDGRPARAAGKFEDPQTHDAGVDNELFRVLGCVRVFRGTLDSPPTYWTYIWGQLKDSQPAWLITISGDDLSKDGEVTVTFDRAMEHLRSNIDGTPRADSTYRLDPDPRSHNEFRGYLKAGEITLLKPGTQGIHLLENPLLMHEWRMTKVHMRLRLTSSGAIEGMVGGYQPWGDLYWAFAAPGASEETQVTGDLVGIYNLFKSHADAERDPVTGQNTAISAAYHVQAVPAFVETVNTTGRAIPAASASR